MVDLFSGFIGALLGAVAALAGQFFLEHRRERREAYRTIAAWLMRTRNALMAIETRLRRNLEDGLPDDSTSSEQFDVVARELTNGDIPAIIDATFPRGGRLSTTYGATAALLQRGFFVLGGRGQAADFVVEGIDPQSLTDPAKDFAKSSSWMRK